MLKANSRQIPAEPRILVFSLALLLISLGLWRDETSFVLWRAINICLGCIGIG